MNRLELKNKLEEVAKHLQKRIPQWESSLVCTTSDGGVDHAALGKVCKYTERLLKIVLLLLNESTKLDSSTVDVLTLGETCRQIKAREKVSSTMQSVTQESRGEFFTLLDSIVRLRNRLIHATVNEDFVRSEKAFHKLLDLVLKLSHSLIITKLYEEEKGGGQKEGKNRGEEKRS